MPTRPFTRSSTVDELATTVPGRAFKALLLRQLPPTQTAAERQELEQITLTLPLEQLVELSEGKLTWGVADSVIDLANNKPHRVLPRAAGAGVGQVNALRRRLLR